MGKKNSMAIGFLLPQCNSRGALSVNVMTMCVQLTIKCSVLFCFSVQDKNHTYVTS